jgi:hypothetical protein
MFAWTYTVDDQILLRGARVSLHRNVLRKTPKAPIAGALVLVLTWCRRSLRRRIKLLDDRIRRRDRVPVLTILFLKNAEGADRWAPRSEAYRQRAAASP